MWKRWLPNERYVTKHSRNLNMLYVWLRRKYTQLCWQSKLQEFTADLQSESGRKNCFRIARQMGREGRLVISVCCMKNDFGNVVSDC